MTERSLDLNELLDDLWTRLEAGASIPDAPARHLALATSRMNGGASVRILVLRSANRQKGILTFFTHRNSGKLRELESDPKAELLLWDQASQFQARLTVTASVLPGSPVLWDRLGDRARLNYARDPIPGERIGGPDAPQPLPDPALLAVLEMRITEMDILRLSTTPQSRAWFRAADGFTGHWVAP